MSSDLIILIPIFFVIALLYSSAGFGGGSSYLAVLAIFPIEFTSIRLIALICNILVVSGSVYLFFKNGYVKIKKILPLILFSIPFAYLGGRIKIEEGIFYIVLAGTLILASFLMLLSTDLTQRKLPKHSNSLLGGGIGFLSGLVGIGGGIFLSPVLHLSKWDTPKVIAGTTASFILVNSISGIFGQVASNGFSVSYSLILSLGAAVFLGGQIGSRLSISILSPLMVKRITAVLIFLIGSRILLKQFELL